MPTTFPPDREADLVPWGLNLKTKVALAPTSYGLTVAMSDALGDSYDEFLSAWQVCQNPATKSKGNVALKDAKKSAFLSEVRKAVRVIQAFPGTTNPMRVDLQLPERGAVPTPSPVPSLVPKVEVKSVYGPNVTLNITDPTDARRALPVGVQGIQLFTATGETAPPPGEGWTAQGVVTRRKITVQFPADSTPPGTKVWFSALYFNRRGLTGLASTPTWSHIGYEGATPMTA